MIKLYFYLGLIGALASYAYFYHYRPIHQYKETIKQLEDKVVDQYNATFEEVQKERKRNIEQRFKDEKNITYDFTDGNHTITI